MRAGPAMAAARPACRDCARPGPRSAIGSAPDCLGLGQGGADDQQLRLGLGDVGSGQVAFRLARPRLGDLPLIGCDGARLDVGEFAVAQHRHIGVDYLVEDLVLGLAQPFTAGEHIGLGSGELRGGAAAAAQQLAHRQRRAHRSLLELRETRIDRAALQPVVIADRRGDADTQPIGRPGLDHAFVQGPQLGALRLELRAVPIGIDDRIDQCLGADRGGRAEQDRSNAKDSEQGYTSTKADKQDDRSRSSSSTSLIWSKVMVPHRSDQRKLS